MKIRVEVRDDERRLAFTFEVPDVPRGELLNSEGRIDDIHIIEFLRRRLEGSQSSIS